jgi:hypothetical protein
MARARGDVGCDTTNGRRVGDACGGGEWGEPGAPTTLSSKSTCPSIRRVSDVAPVMRRDRVVNNKNLGRMGNDAMDELRVGGASAQCAWAGLRTEVCGGGGDGDKKNIGGGCPWHCYTKHSRTHALVTGLQLLEHACEAVGHGLDAQQQWEQGSRPVPPKHGPCDVHHALRAGWGGQLSVAKSLSLVLSTQTVKAQKSCGMHAVPDPPPLIPHTRWSVSSHPYNHLPPHPTPPHPTPPYSVCHCKRTLTPVSTKLRR